ncbi:MAG: hypothetical protein WD696_22705 [Bryobacteraceae bacterium]
MRPGSALKGVIRRFTRGKEHPRGVVWFGARSFWGHLRHLIASAIATESIDSRDWMTPDEPLALVARISGVLGGNPNATTLIEALGRDLYVDFVADTGDDVAVSRAVARLVFAPYELPDPDRPGGFLLAPRGEILLFGGDTAYPVATAQELMNRVIAPWNQVLQALPDDGRRRVLLGVPGNHDWYDGLDGFGRMFRRHAPGPAARASVTRIVSPMMLEHHAEWAREFVRGGRIEKPEALGLSGYTSVQNASYFALPLAPAIELLAVDRQLTATDSRQTEFLGDYYQAHPDSAILAVLPDPVYHFGDPSRTGTQMVESLHLDLASRETFVLTGDIHHYERLERGKALHVIAGGGGAFLHPARIAEGGLTPTVVWPDVAQSRMLLRTVPWKLALGRSGFLPHFVLLALFALAYVLSQRLYAHTGLAVSASILTTLFIGGIYALIGGVTRRPLVLPFAFVAALVTVLLPIGGSLFLNMAFERLGWSASVAILGLSTIAIGVFTGAFVFGSYLALLTLLGYENMQAFTVLDHPGFKHFVRLRVRADGRGIDGWCIGAADPLGDGEEPVLVDHFSWRPFGDRK